MRRDGRLAAHLAALAGLAALALAPSCGGRAREWPFPALDLAPSEFDGVLRSRVDAVRTVTAVLQVAFDSAARSGSFDLVCVYRRPDDLHMSAFKSLLLASRPLFELTFAGDRFRLVLHDEDAAEDTNGKLEDFPARHPDLAALYWTRELMFLPGKSAAPWRVTAETASEVELEGRSADSCSLRLVAERATLGVRSTRVQPPGGVPPCEIEYPGYRRAGDAWMPIEVASRAVDGSFSMRAVVVEMDVNEPVDESVFELP